MHFIASSGATGVLALRAPGSGRAPPRSCLPLPAISCSNQLILPWPIEGSTRPTPTNTLELIHWSCLPLPGARPSDRETRERRPDSSSTARPTCGSHPLALASVSASPTCCLDGAVRRNRLGSKLTLAASLTHPRILLSAASSASRSYAFAMSSDSRLSSAPDICSAET